MQKYMYFFNVIELIAVELTNASQKKHIILFLQRLTMENPRLSLTDINTFSARHFFANVCCGPKVRKLYRFLGADKKLERVMILP
jgi:hypothetical protein